MNSSFVIQFWIRADGMSADLVDLVEHFGSLRLFIIKLRKAVRIRQGDQIIDTAGVLREAESRDLRPGRSFMVGRSVEAEMKKLMRIAGSLMLLMEISVIYVSEFGPIFG
jgi:hypothetical protein